MKRNALLAAIAPAVLATAIGPAGPDSLSGATAWLNTKPLTLSGLRGKVVLVDFWTYTCVNWRRTLPYVRAWAKKYGKDGLVVIGVHTPEFSFEHKLDNVRRAVTELDVGYPVAVDNDYVIWNAFNNQYWPAIYLIAANGNVRWHQFGEGAYDDAERTIQSLLVESGHHSFDRNLVAVHPRGLEFAADSADLRSAETYIGYGRGTPRVYPTTISLGLNEWALYGNWSVDKEAAFLNTPEGRIAYRFHARDVNLVMGPGRPGTKIRFRVLLDGRPPGPSHGDDVDANGLGTVSRQDTYQLIRQAKPIVDRLFEIEFLDQGVEAYDFTFG
jgi:thiol-disulfide isomerase/thioredoxin